MVHFSRFDSVCQHDLPWWPNAYFRTWERPYFSRGNPHLICPPLLLSVITDLLSSAESREKELWMQHFMYIINIPLANRACYVMHCVGHEILLFTTGMQYIHKNMQLCRRLPVHFYNKWSFAHPDEQHRIQDATGLGDSPTRQTCYETSGELVVLKWKRHHFSLLHPHLSVFYDPLMSVRYWIFPAVQVLQLILLVCVLVCVYTFMCIHRFACKVQMLREVKYHVVQVTPLL